jgi:hypothetical protein
VLRDCFLQCYIFTGVTRLFPTMLYIYRCYEIVSYNVIYSQVLRDCFLQCYIFTGVTRLFPTVEGIWEWRFRGPRWNWWEIYTREIKIYAGCVCCMYLPQQVMTWLRDHIYLTSLCIHLLWIESLKKWWSTIPANQQNKILAITSNHWTQTSRFWSLFFIGSVISVLHWV